MITIGIDEVGRGCWAGPLVAAAVVLDADLPMIQGLDDSKKLTSMKREKLSEVIHARALAIGIGWIWSADIDINGITTAVKGAMEQAVTEVMTQLAKNGYLYDEIVIDGNYNYLLGLERVRTMVGADGIIQSVSAASIVAKVARDTYMRDDAAVEYPEYGFEKHVGYGTAQHIAALQARGVTPIHRLSYKPIRALLT